MLDEITQIQSSADLIHSEKDVETAISRMAAEINEVLRDKNPVILCVMNGGVVFTGKLLTQLPFPLTFDSINASRYRNNTSGAEIQWLYQPKTDLNNRIVLIVDDILDEGLTLEAIITYCKEQGATAVYTAVLIDKKLTQKKPVTADFVGLYTENRYLFGYGMDYKGYLRNAPGIYACKD